MKTEDRILITELLARSAYTLDQREVDELRDTFTQDVSFVVDVAGMDGEMRFEGRDALMGFITDTMAEQTDQRRHVVTNTFITEAGEDAAKVVSDLTITSVENGAARLATTGMYRDTVRRVGDQWRIAARRVELDMAY